MDRVLRHRFCRSTLLFWACIGFLSGVGLARLGFCISGYIMLLLIVAALLCAPKRGFVAIIIVASACVGLGIWRGSIGMTELGKFNSEYGNQVTITVKAAEDAVYGRNSQILFQAEDVRLSNGQRLIGRVQISGFGLNSVLQNDEVTASGKLRPGFGSDQGELSYAKLELISHHPTLVADIRRRFAASLQSVLPEPLAPFAMGLLIGQRASLPAEVKQDLLAVGLTHIIAVSGYNLTIMLSASTRVLGNRSKRMTTAASFGLMLLFILLAGMSASIARAAIVSTLSIMAGYYGRSVKPLILILLAAVVTAYTNPYYLWGDASWYLSFLAFFGILVLAPLITSRLTYGWLKSVVAMVAIESLCAEIMTLPYVLHTFGQMSLLGLTANVVVATMVPLAMLLSTVAGIAGMTIGSLAGWLSWPAWWLLTYMLDLAHIMSKIPHTFFRNLSFSVAQMLFIYLIVVLICLLLRGKRKTILYDKVTDRQKPKIVRSLAG